MSIIKYKRVSIIKKLITEKKRKERKLNIVIKDLSEKKSEMSGAEESKV